MALESPIDGRGTYVVPWANNILVGTTDIFYDGDKDHIPIRDQSVEYLLDLINHYFPKFHLQKRDIQGVFVGIRPLIGSDKGRDEDRVSRDYQILVDARGLVSITGGKLTSYRSMAKKALNEIIRYFFKNRKFNKCQTVSPISGGDVENLNREKLYKKFNHITISKIDSLILRYGTNAEKILYYTQGNSSKGEHIQKGMPYLWAEIDYMVGYEYVEKLSDVLFRRANIFHILEDNGYALCEPIARYMAPLMGWDANRVEREVQEYRGYLKEIFQGLNKPYIEQLQKERVS
jgi:glycerol-3-phosphate dehydrogenase